MSAGLRRYIHTFEAQHAPGPPPGAGRSGGCGTHPLGALCRDGLAAHSGAARDALGGRVHHLLRRSEPSRQAAARQGRGQRHPRPRLPLQRGERLCRHRAVLHGPRLRRAAHRPARARAQRGARDLLRHAGARGCAPLGGFRAGQPARQALAARRVHGRGDGTHGGRRGLRHPGRGHSYGQLLHQSEGRAGLSDDAAVPPPPVSLCAHRHAGRYAYRGPGLRLRQRFKGGGERQGAGAFRLRGRGQEPAPRLYRKAPRGPRRPRPHAGGTRRQARPVLAAGPGGLRQGPGRLYEMRKDGRCKMHLPSFCGYFVSARVLQPQSRLPAMVWYLIQRL